jgi:hypothetical protein
MADTFEILCVDAQNATVLLEAPNVIHALLANSTLWQSSQLTGCPPDLEINDQDLHLSVEKLDIDLTKDSLLRRSFLIRCTGTYNRVERIRLPLCKYLKSQGFEFIYVIKDEVSEYIAQQIYPSINKVENRLRKYIIKFFITKLGPNWWEVTADSEMKKKASQRRNNETVFGPETIDNKVYLIDFGELGKIVYQQSSGYLSREDIIRKVLELGNSPEAVEKIKLELQSNYTKFFKETFKDQNFQQQWEEIEKLRHKVAHNNLFTDEDSQNSKQLYESILKTIEEADSKIDKIVFSTDDLETIKSNIIEVSDPYKIITEEELTDQLKKREEYYSRTNGFVGLTSFIKNHLGLLGYDYKASHALINSLAQQGKIEIYHVEGPNEFKVAAIRSKQATAQPASSHSLQ